jgi:hypothetical protein
MKTVGGDDGVCVSCLKFGGVELGSASRSSTHTHTHTHTSVPSFGAAALDQSNEPQDGLFASETTSDD